MPEYNDLFYYLYLYREALTGFDAEGLDFGAHVIGGVAQSADVRGHFD